METNVSITYWSNPIIIKEYTPYRHWWEYQPSTQPYYTTASVSTFDTNGIDLNNGGTITTSGNTQNYSIYNLELN